MNKLIMRYHGERIDFERVLKYMPNAAQQLKERKISIHEFSKNVTDVFWEMDNPVGVGFYEIIALIASSCWQQPIEALPELEIMFLNRFVVTITEEFFKEYDELESLHDSVFFEPALLLLQSSFEKTCRAFSTLMDVSQFRGKQGAFLRWCPFYGIASLEKFADVLGTSLDVPNVCPLFITARNAERRKGQVKRDAGLAAYALSTCLDDAWMNCWECGKTAFCPTCSRCSVAQYCGRDCQVKARSRHKPQCIQSKEAYYFLLENLRIINDAHEIGTMHGVRLNGLIDYLNTVPRLMDIMLDQTNYGLPADGPRCVCVCVLLRQVECIANAILFPGSE